jgi:3D (Asp-Asp-Asp) domain-containing protein
LSSFAAIALVVLAAPALGSAGSSGSASSLRAQNARLEARSRSAVLELYSLDQRLSGAQTHVGQLRAQAVSLRAERAGLEQQLQIAKRGRQIAQRRLADRLRLLYEQGNVEPLEVVFGSKNLEEALSSLDTLNRMTVQSGDVLRQLTSARASLTRASARLREREASLAAATLQARNQSASLAATQASRHAFLRSLSARRSLNDSQIASLVAQARAAQVRSAKVVRRTAADAAALVVPSAVAAITRTSGARRITVTATGYSLAGTTATGLRVGWGVAAVDPAVIPLGAHLTIPGYGAAVAADTGGSVVGAVIDLWFPTVKQANAWGRRTVTIVVS